MRSGIDESAALAGVPVVVRDIDEAAFEGGRARIEKSLGRARAGGKIEDGGADVRRRLRIRRGHRRGDEARLRPPDGPILYAIGDSLYEEFKQREYAPRSPA